MNHIFRWTPAVPGGQFTSPNPDPDHAGQANHDLDHAGFYGPTYTLEEITDLLHYDAAELGLRDEINAARIAVRRILQSLDQNGDLTGKEFHAALTLVFDGLATIGRLLQYQQHLVDSPDELNQFIQEALEEVSRRRGIDLLSKPT